MFNRKILKYIGVYNMYRCNVYGSNSIKNEDENGRFLCLKWSRWILIGSVCDILRIYRVN